MEKIQCISIPRSGHHLLVNILCKYFSRDLDAYETNGLAYKGHETVLKLGEFAYCEFYRHCQTIPCLDPETTFQKNHDLDLTLPKDPRYKYLIQYRHPLDVAVSHYKWELKYYEHQGAPKQDDYENWMHFLGAVPPPKMIGYPRWAWRWMRRFRSGKDFRIPYRLMYWKKFIHKWVLAEESRDYLFLPYHELMQEPKKMIMEVLQFMDPDIKIDEVLLDQIIVKINVKQRNSVEKFVYYDEKFFRKLEQFLLPEMDRLQIPRIFK